jgi:hypothetical protein
VTEEMIEKEKHLVGFACMDVFARALFHFPVALLTLCVLKKKEERNHKELWDTFFFLHVERNTSGSL